MVLLTAMALAGCEGDRRADAESIVARYLEQVAGAEEDRGWSLLLETTRRTTFDDDREAYIARAAATEWDDFDWTIASVERDEPYLYQVVVEASDGTVLPDLIRELAYFDEGDEGVGGTRGTIMVRFPPVVGESGIHHRGD